MSPSSPPRVYGLTGGIASGKSTAARFLSEAGIPVVDADEIARELRKPGGAAHTAILARFGTVDPLELRQRVFSDPQARLDLEAILHPLIRAESLRKIQALRAPVVIYEATLLVESGRFRDFSGLILVEAGRDERIRRVMARDGSSRELAESILGSQGTDETRRAAADYILDNSGSPELLRTRVEALVPKL